MYWMFVVAFGLAPTFSSRPKCRQNWHDTDTTCIDVAVRSHILRPCVVRFFGSLVHAIVNRINCNLARPIFYCGDKFNLIPKISLFVALPYRPTGRRFGLYWRYYGSYRMLRSSVLTKCTNFSPKVASIFRQIS
jgi:hypothetical protein